MRTSGASVRVPEPGEVIAERYRVERVLSAEVKRRRILALELPGERRVEIVELPTEAHVAWTAAMTLEHASLPALVATISRQGAAYAVFVETAGSTLEELSREGVRFDVASAVRAAQCLVDAAERLRRAGIVHGAIDAGCIVFRSPKDPESVVLGYRGVLAADSPYRRPERAPDEPSDPSDDAWGLSGALFQLLTGKPPPRGGVYSEEQLREAGIDDDVLRGVLLQGLAANAGRRSRRLGSLAHPLAHWLARHTALDSDHAIAASAPRSLRSLSALGLSRVTDDPNAPSIEVRSAIASEPLPEDDELGEPRPRASSAPPAIEIHETALESERPPPLAPLSEGPPSFAAIATSSPPGPNPADPRPSTRRSTFANPSVWLGLVLGAGVTIGIFSWLERGRERSPAVTAPVMAAPLAPKTAGAASSAPPAPSAPAAVASAPPSVAPHRVAHESTGECVARHMPEGSVESAPNMDFLCTTHDPRKGDHLLRAALTREAEGKPRAGLRMWNELTWYALAGYAALRAACCPDAPKIELPAPGPNCSALGPVLDELGRAAVSGGDTAGPLASFAQAIECEMGHRRGPVFWRKQKPGGAEPTTLRGLLASVETPRPPR